MVFIYPEEGDGGFFFWGGGSHGFQGNEGRIRCRQQSIKGTKALVEEERKFG